MQSFVELAKLAVSSLFLDNLLSSICFKIGIRAEKVTFFSENMSVKSANGDKALSVASKTSKSCHVGTRCAVFLPAAVNKRDGLIYHKKYRKQTKKWYASLVKCDKPYKFNI